jgi:hypothetical protein
MVAGLGEGPYSTGIGETLIAVCRGVPSFMPAKKNHISDEERRKRIREAAKKLDTSDDPKEFEKAFKKVTAQQLKQARS